MELVLNRPSKSSKAKNYNILYVDDEETNLRIFNHAFKRDYNVFTALTGDLALELMENNRIDLIITDQQMPKMTGVDLLAKVVPKHPKIVRMIMTGFSDIGAIIRAVNEFGLDKYLTKPWNKDQLKNEFDRALEKKAAEKTPGDSDGSAEYASWLNSSLLPKENELQKHLKEYFILHGNDSSNTNSYWFGDFNGKLLMSFFGSNDKQAWAQIMNSFVSSKMTSLVYKEQVSDPEAILADLSKLVQEGYKSKGASENNASIDMSVLLIDTENGTVAFAGANQNLHYFDKDEKYLLLRGGEKALTTSSNPSISAQTLKISDLSRAYLISKNILNAENPYFDSIHQLLDAMGGISMDEQSKMINSKLKDLQKKTIIGLKF